MGVPLFIHDALVSSGLERLIRVADRLSRQTLKFYKVYFLWSNISLITSIVRSVKFLHTFNLSVKFTSLFNIRQVVFKRCCALVGNQRMSSESRWFDYRPAGQVNVSVHVSANVAWPPDIGEMLEANSAKVLFFEVKSVIKKQVRDKFSLLPFILYFGELLFSYRSLNLSLIKLFGYNLEAFRVSILVFFLTHPFVVIKIDIFHRRKNLLSQCSVSKYRNIL